MTPTSPRKPGDTTPTPWFATAADAASQAAKAHADAGGALSVADRQQMTDAALRLLAVATDGHSESDGVELLESLMRASMAGAYVAGQMLRSPHMRMVGLITAAELAALRVQLRKHQRPEQE